MPDRLNQIASFVHIASSGSLSAAAKTMGVSLGAVSKRLSQLEARLGVTLLHRNTRTLALTERGRAFFDRTAHLLAELESAEQEVAQAGDALAGSLRITATEEFGRRRLPPLLQAFRLAHPELRIHLDLTNAPTNPIEGGYDMAIWVGDPPSSSLIVRRLATNRRVICAAPAYLLRQGLPRDLDDLARHDCIVVGAAEEARWRLADGQSLRLRRPLSTNDLELAHAWVLAGAGLAIRSLWDIADDVEGGRLQIVLPQVALPDMALNAVYPKSRDGAGRVRACIGFLSERLKAASPAQ